MHRLRHPLHILIMPPLPLFFILHTALTRKILTNNTSLCDERKILLPRSRLPKYSEAVFPALIEAHEMLHPPSHASSVFKQSLYSIVSRNHEQPAAASAPKSSPPEKLLLITPLLFLILLNIPQ